MSCKGDSINSILGREGGAEDAYMKEEDVEVLTTLCEVVSFFLFENF